MDQNIERTNSNFHERNTLVTVALVDVHWASGTSGSHHVILVTCCDMSNGFCMSQALMGKGRESWIKA